MPGAGHHGGVFSRPGVYSSPETFVAGFRSALWIAVAFSAAGTEPARAPLGRNEGDPPQLRVRRHDEYHDAYATGR